MIGLRGYPVVSLNRARAKALRNLVIVDAGTDPYLEKHGKNEPTLAEAFGIVVESKSRKWSNPREAYDWSRSFETYANPLIGDMPVSTIEPSHLLEVLNPIRTE